MDSVSETARQHGELTSLAGKYLTFELGEETYGVGILKFQEIIKMQEITKFPAHRSM